MKKIFFLFSTALFFSLNLCAQTLPDNIDISGSANGIVPLPSSVPSIYISEGFVKYTKIQCPNGEAIHFIAQDQLTDAQIVRVRTLLEFYLTNVPGSIYGADKTGVKNTMGINGATLQLVNGTHSDTNETSIPAQPLYQNEIAVEGHAWYQNNDYDHRDASFEEILHMMHDMGIGVDGINSISNPALPAFQAEIRTAQDTADNNFQIWPLTAASDTAWYNELRDENSLSQEYLASVIDSYYGLWAPWTDDPNTGMWGEYIAHDRAEIQTEDPLGWALLPKYFSPYINVDMLIDPSFTGVFSMSFNPSDPYTHKSQYLQHCYLTGNNNSGLKGNDLYNRLKGNDGDNTLEGLKGNDRLNGHSGTNTAKFAGMYSEYTVNNLTTYAIVQDNIANRDGVDTLWNIHNLEFSDQTIPITLINTVGVNDIEQNSNITIYPNPVMNELYIENVYEGSVFEIKTIDGKLLEKGVLIDNRINVSRLTVGAYILQVKSTTNSQVKISKFFKK